MWQDYVISVAGFIFAIVMIPQLIDVYYGKKHVNKISSGLTSGFQVVLFVTYATLGLFLSCVSVVVLAIVWMLLFIFTILNENKTDYIEL